MKKLMLMIILMIGASAAFGQENAPEPFEIPLGTYTGAADKTGGKRIWHLTVESRDDIGASSAEFKADLKKALEELGGTVVEQASKESIDLNFYIGKDDTDDDNDGTPDDKDPDDYNDGIEDASQQIKTVDVDKAIPDEMANYEDKNKSEGIYIFVTSETGKKAVFLTKADSLEEAEEVGFVAISYRNAFIPKVSVKGGLIQLIAYGAQDMYL